MFTSNSLRFLALAVTILLSLASTADKRAEELNIVFLETSGVDQLPIQQAKKAGFSVSVVGNGLNFLGFGQKWRLVREEIMKLSSDAVVIVADARDTLLNLPKVWEDQPSMVGDFVAEAKKSFFEITEGNKEAVLFGTEFQCCVFAMTHVKPVDYFDETGTKRDKRACTSGKDDCGWKGSIKALPWLEFQVNLAKERTGGVEVADPFLNAGLVMGTAKNLINIIDLADFEDEEDDQAVFTGLMYRRPELILLDYANEVFGTARFTLGMEEGGCVFEKSSVEKGNLLQHEELKSTPLLVHTPNHFYYCLDNMAGMLGKKRSQAMKALTHDAHPVWATDENREDARRSLINPYTGYAAARQLSGTSGHAGRSGRQLNSPYTGYGRTTP